MRIIRLCLLWDFFVWVFFKLRFYGVNFVEVFGILGNLSLVSIKKGLNYWFIMVNLVDNLSK